MNQDTMSQNQNAIKGTGWQAGLLLGLVFGGMVALFFDSAQSMVAIWIRSETFAHGFLILPISLWLIWDKRKQLAAMRPQPAYLPLLLMLPVGFAWLIANLVDVLVVQQFAFVAMLILAVWAVIGTPIARLLAFPLGFLFLAVPVGEGLIYPMMNFTADFTVGMLKLTGIPVYREGTFFSIPSGDWSVVEGCSGVRYLIASITLGILYAYLTYTKLWKRLLFVAFSVGVPIVANGLRAYMIVMIAHLSDMKLALGVDHLIYGWVFFGIVVTIMFVIGSFWRDAPPQADQRQTSAGRRGPAKNPLPAALMSLLVAGIWPGVALSVAHHGGDVEKVDLSVPVGVAGWQRTAGAAWDWRPHIVGADGQFYQFYSKDNRIVGLYLGLYRRQRQDAELVNSQNFMIEQKHPVWSNKEKTRQPISLHGEEVVATQGKLASPRQRLLVWNWYRLGDYYTSNPYLAKLIEASARLFDRRQDGAMIVVAAPYDEKPQAAAKNLQEFLNAMLGNIEEVLDQAVTEG